MSDPFKTLGDYSTDKKSYLYGLLPSLSTIFTLAAVSAVLAFIPMLWAQAALQASLYISYFAYTALSVIGVSAFNFWFDREVQYYTLGCGPINPNDKFGDVNLFKLVNHLVQELNALDGTEDPNHPNHLKMPRLAKYSNLKPEIVTIPGRNIGDGALYFSDGMLNSDITRFSQKELAGMIMAELYKIKRRRSIADRLHGLVESLNQTLNNLMESPNILLKGLGYLCLPLKLCFLIHNAVLRSHVYESAEAVVRSGRGESYYDALNRKGHASRTRKVSDKEVKVEENLNHRILLKREPYAQPCYDWMRQNAFFKYFSFVGKALDSILRPIANWIDSKELLTDEKQNTSRFVRFFDIVLRHIGFYVKEINSSKPSGPNVKNHISTLLQDDKVDKRPPRIPEEDIYEPIDHAKSIELRMRKAARLGDLSYADVKDTVVSDRYGLYFAQETRVACKQKMISFLEKKGLVYKKDITKDDIRGVLEPLMFRHRVDTSQVQIVDNEHRSLTTLSDLLRAKQKPFTEEELQPLYEGKTFNPPTYKP